MVTAQGFVNVAKAEVGNGPKKYNTGGQAWCAIFVNWCLKRIGYGKCGTAAAVSFASFGEQHKPMDGYMPKAGDLLLVNYNGVWADHVAIVESYNGLYMETINGNGTGNKVTRSRRAYTTDITVIEMRWGNDFSYGDDIPDYDDLEEVLIDEESSSGDSSEKVTYFSDTNEVIPVHPTIFSLPDRKIDGEYAVYINNHDVTASVSPLGWQNTRKELAVKVEITVAKTDTRFTNLYHPQKGDIVRVFLPQEVFRGIIIAADEGGRHSLKFTAVDPGYHLGKCEDTYQFNNMDAVLAIKKICSDLGVPIVYLDEEGLKGVAVTGVYIDKAVSAVIWAILEKAGGKWNYDFVPGGIRIYRIGTYVTTPQFRTSANTMLRDSVKYRGTEKKTSSVESMHNAVKVVSDTNVLAKIRHDGNYQKYGLLQKVVKIDPEKENAGEVMEAKLAELNVEKNTWGFEMPVLLSDYSRAGEILVVDGVRYSIETADHKIEKGRHMVGVTLERVEIT